MFLQHNIFYAVDATAIVAEYCYTHGESIGASCVSYSNMSFPLTRYFSGFISFILLTNAPSLLYFKTISYDTFSSYIIMMAVRGYSEGEIIVFKGKIRLLLNNRMGGGGQLCIIIHWYHLIYHLTNKSTCPVTRNTG